MSRIEGPTPKGRAMVESGRGANAWLTLTKPGVVVLLQITALCAVCLLYTSPSPRDRG